jgi:type IV fimbrial biogenesis protein FimT
MLVKPYLRSRERAHCRHRGPMRGFTLIELLITIAVIAILATLAAPSFNQFIATQRIKTASFDLMSTLALVRSEAITRNANVSLLRTQSTWDRGWTVSADAGASTLLTQQPYNGLSITDSAGLSQITYGRDGRPTTASTKFTIGPASAMAGVTSRCLSIGLGGSPSTSLGGC